MRFIKPEILAIIDLYDDHFPNSVDERRAKDLERLIQGYFKYDFDYARGMMDAWVELGES